MTNKTKLVDELQLHPSIQRMARNMQYKLDKNANKKGWPEDENGQRGWMNDACSIEFLQRKLLEEVSELFDALEGRGNVALEAADVANIAMMLADKFEAGACSERVQDKERKND